MISGVRTEWLQKRGTIADFERAQLEQAAVAFNLPLDRVIEKLGNRPFGVMTDRVRAFGKRVEEGDELWSFSSKFEGKCGCAGFAIVRAGKIRDTLVTIQA